MKRVAFIPARSGSKRVPDKNIKLLGGHPLLAYSVSAALACGIFDAVICATDSRLYADIAVHYGAESPYLRSAAISDDASPDIEWILWLLDLLKKDGREFDVFSILRPTAPFRLPKTIQRAWNVFEQDPGADSLRAVAKCVQHPGKMWIIQGGRMLPLLPFSRNGIPWHSNQYKALPDVYVQDASLEIAWTRTPLEKKSIAGETVISFISQGLEGFDINTPEDWLLAEHYVKTGEARLPAVIQQPFCTP